MKIFQLLKEFLELPWMYNSWRIGENEKEFLCYKFRTMVINADQNKPKSTLYKKSSHDSRILKSKGWMRRIGFDELPQLINVAKGEMNFFGPRPLVKSDWLQLTEHQKKIRLQHLPGCFGPYSMLRDKKNRDNLLKANDAYARLLYRKKKVGKLETYKFNFMVFILTIKAILQGKVK